MPEYRIYVMGPGNHILALADAFTCKSDQEAVEHTKRLQNGRELLELWQGARRIRHIGASYK